MAAALLSPTMDLSRTGNDFEAISEDNNDLSSQGVKYYDIDFQVDKIQDLLKESSIDTDISQYYTDHVINNRAILSLNSLIIDNLYEFEKDRNKKAVKKSKFLRLGFIFSPTLLLLGLLFVGFGYNIGVGISILSLSSLGLSFFGFWLESGIEIINIRILTAFTIGTFLISLLNLSKNIF